MLDILDAKWVSMIKKKKKKDFAGLFQKYNNFNEERLQRGISTRTEKGQQHWDNLASQ